MNTPRTGRQPGSGRQTPTQGVTLPYERTHGGEAVALYEQTGRAAQEWQRLLLYDILAENANGLWVHTKFGYSVPRRNGKNEIVAAREMYGLVHGEHILHTAHRTTTSSSASRRLAALLDAAGYTEVIRAKKTRCMINITLTQSSWASNASRCWAKAACAISARAPARAASAKGSTCW